MSRRVTALLAAMLVLAGAMGLKTAVAAHSNSAVLIANGSDPLPPDSIANGSDPLPPDNAR
jgi:hypothetical protein